MRVMPWWLLSMLLMLLMLILTEDLTEDLTKDLIEGEGEPRMRRTGGGATPATHVSRQALAEKRLDDYERQRRERMPSAVCHLKKVRRLRGCCTWVQARSRQGDARARRRAYWCAERLYQSNRDPEQTDDLLDVPLTLAT